MKFLNLFIDYHVNFLKDCLKNGRLDEKERELLVEYRDKLVDMALIFDNEGVGRNKLTEFISLRFEEELGVQ